MKSGSLGQAISNHLMNKNPAIARQKEIEVKDERNIAINNQAKAKAFDLMLFIFGALIIAFAFMQVEMPVVLAVIAAYLLIVAVQICYLGKFQKEL